MIYKNNVSYAKEHKELEEFKQSLQKNVKCKERIEELIKENFDGYHLNSSAALTALAEHGERVEYVLAMTVQAKDYDGRFSEQNKEWAHSIQVCQDERCIVNSHPAVLDGFIDMIRIESFYVKGDTVKFFDNLDDAISEYLRLPNHKEKVLGKKSATYCKEFVHRDYDINIAYRIPGGYMHIQTSSEGGYDYTFYDEKLSVVEGGVYDDSESPAEEVILEILEDYLEGAMDIISMEELQKNKILESVEPVELEEKIGIKHITAAYRFADHSFIIIQIVSDGYRYTIYDKNYKELNGCFADADDPIEEILMEMLKDNLKDIWEDVSFEELMECNILKVMDLDELEDKIENRPLVADDVAIISGKSYSFDKGSREMNYIFDCVVDGQPTVLTYTTGQRTRFYSTTFCEDEAVFSIHTAGNDIWDRMSVAELSKLESILDKAAAAYLEKNRIEKSDNIPKLMDQYYCLMETPSSAMTQEQWKCIWEEMSQRAEVLLKQLLDQADTSSDFQKVKSQLEDAQSILDETKYQELKGLIKRWEDVLIP